MIYRELGKTGLQVSVIGIGTHQFAGEQSTDPRSYRVCFDKIAGRLSDFNTRWSL
jgi:aryl-alcohol dehydrogenase-like predicted oxidoreductase